MAIGWIHHHGDVREKRRLQDEAKYVRDAVFDYVEGVAAVVRAHNLRIDLSVDRFWILRVKNGNATVPAKNFRPLMRGGAKPHRPIILGTSVGKAGVVRIDGNRIELADLEVAGEIDPERRPGCGIGQAPDTAVIAVQ